MSSSAALEMGEVGGPTGRSAIKLRPCPTCGTKASSTSASVSSRRRAEDLSLKELREHWLHFFKERVFFTYHRCASCGLLFCPLFFGQEELATMYGNTIDNTFGLPDRLLLKTQRSYFEFLLEHVKPPELTGSYLELGPDVGMLTEIMATNGGFEKFWLFEPNREVHAALARRLEGRDVQIRTEMLDFSGIPDQSVSVAALIHVVDHLLDPRETLLRLREKMKPGGVLLVVTHDESSLLARILGNRWPPYCLQHPQLFSPASTGDLLARASFELEAVRKTFNHFPVMHLVKHLFSAYGHHALRVPTANWITVPLKLGNIISLSRLRT